MEIIADELKLSQGVNFLNKLDTGGILGVGFRG